jgi:hypothetical protein
VTSLKGISRRSLFLFPLAARPEEGLRHIRLISVAPSPFTRRRDSFRAGAGILMSIRRLAAEHQLSVQSSYYDAAPSLNEPERLKAMVRGAGVLLVGSSVWAQGPSHLVRQFFEAVNAERLDGVMASAWVTSGGVHTGGEMAHESALATLRGMGAAIFTFGQKQAVFSTDERLGPEKEGEYTLLDCWFMEGLAKASIVAALAPGDPARARALWEKLGSAPSYWHGFFPKDPAELARRFGEMRRLLNAAAAPGSAERKQLDGMLAK